MAVFRIFSVLGLLLSLADFIGQLTSSPICKADGCALVNQLTPYGSMPFTIAGIVLFTLLIVLSFYKKICFLLDYVIAAAFIIEGMLLGYQNFYLNKFCVVCVGIAAIIGILFALRAYQSKKWIISSFALTIYLALFVVSGFLYTPMQGNSAEGSVAWQPVAGWTIVYSKDCSHCEDLLKAIALKNGLNGQKKSNAYKDKIHLVDVKKAKGFLIVNGINIVPVLVIKGKNRLDIVAGEIAIKNKLLPKPAISGVTGLIDGINNVSNIGNSVSNNISNINTQSDSCGIDDLKNCN